jgi:polyhydroxyalkanoate synthesis regulator protein
MRDAFGGNVLADIAKRNMEMFEGASRAFTPRGKSGSEKPARDNDVDQLRAELAELQAKVDRLAR